MRRRPRLLTRARCKTAGAATAARYLNPEGMYPARVYSRPSAATFLFPFPLRWDLTDLLGILETGDHCEGGGGRCSSSGDARELCVPRTTQTDPASIHDPEKSNKGTEGQRQKGKKDTRQEEILRSGDGGRGVGVTGSVFILSDRYFRPSVFPIPCCCKMKEE